MSFDTSLAITVRPHFCNKWPEITLGIDNEILFQGLLEKTTTFDYNNILSATDHTIWLEFSNKTNQDTTANADQAVELISVEFEKISTDKMIWAGVYTPIYPEPWASEQQQKGNLLSNTIKSVTYLGWNGRWELTFSVPVFTWIHKIENLGWIYS